MKGTKTLHQISFLLVIIGAVDWGLIGLGQFAGNQNWDLVAYLLGSWPALLSLVYLLVGLGAVYLIATHKKDCKYCSVSM